VKKIYKFIH
jgi:hypothetical protein